MPTSFYFFCIPSPIRSLRNKRSKRKRATQHKYLRLTVIRGNSNTRRVQRIYFSNVQTIFHVFSIYVCLLYIKGLLYEKLLYSFIRTILQKKILCPFDIGPYIFMCPPPFFSIESGSCSMDNLTFYAKPIDPKVVPGVKSQYSRYQFRPRLPFDAR